MKTIVPIALLIILLCACSSRPDQELIQSPIPLTTTVAKTITVQPSVTRSASPIATTATTQKTGTPDADTLKVQRIATIEALYPGCYGLPTRGSGSELSPDGRWLTMECRGKGNASDSLLVINIQDDQQWNIPANDFIAPIHWSGDGKYLFATISSGNEGCCFMSNTLSLIRLNLDSGEQDEIVKYPNINDNENGVVGVDFSISPSDRYALYIPQDYKNNLYILDLITHKLKVIEIKFDNLAAGRTIMSNDDKNVVLMLMEPPLIYQPDDPYLMYSSVVVMNLETGLQRRLLTGARFNDAPVPVRWMDDSHVELNDGHNTWLLNIHTQELTTLGTP